MDPGYDAGRRAFQDGDYATALVRLRPLAKDGHTKALYILSLMYAEGLGVARDPKEALSWLHKAVDAGLKQAHVDLGATCSLSHEVLATGAAELESIHTAANVESSHAQLDLGFKYARGQDVPRNDHEAVRWFHRAAENGSREAQAALGFMYADGRGVSQDDIVAVKWFRQAADQGLTAAQLALGFLYSVGRVFPETICRLTCGSASPKAPTLTTLVGRRKPSPRE